MSTPFVLVDGSSYFFRAFHALPPLINSKGQATGAIYGVASMIKRLINESQSKNMVIVFDAKGKNFRHDMYPAYKANRPPMPPELSGQFHPLRSLLEAMGLPLLSIPDVEADDVIGTLAKQAAGQGISVLISSSDKDLAQLVDGHIHLINTMSNQRLDPAGVLNKFGVNPQQIIDYLALMGDASDNIPGIPKCGPKTAAKWLNQYQNIEGLLEHIDEIPGKIGQYLKENLDQLALSRKLVTINTQLDLGVQIEDLIIRPFHPETLPKCLEELEFKSWLKELQNPKHPTASLDTQITARPFQIITEESRFNELIRHLEVASCFAFDAETTSLSIIDAELVGLSFAWDSQDPVYLPLAHDEASPQLDRQKVLCALKPIFENPKIRKIGQNLKYDYAVLRSYQIKVQGMDYDTMLESYIFNSSSRRHDLDSLAKNWLNMETIHFEDIAGTGKNKKTFNQIPIARAAAYASEDAGITLALHEKIYPQLSPNLKKVLHDIEMPLVPILANMERHGVLIDPEILNKQGIRLRDRLSELEEKAYLLAGHPFNLNSPKQLQHIFYEEQKIPVVGKTPKGQNSTSEAVLSALALQYPLPAVILEYRGISKLVSTYTEALPKRIHPSTHRVHTSYNQAITATGRLSSSDPNLQNIPIRTEEGRLIRQAFIAPKGQILVTADYSQIELRIMAHLSQDPALLHAFSQGWDIHQATASEIFARPLDQISSEERRRAKAVNFGLIYGMSAFGLANQLGINRVEAQSYIDRYFERYPGVLDYMERTKEQARKNGFVETIFGRRLHLPEIHSPSALRRKAAERAAINAPMQGTAADIIKKSMIAIAEALENHPKFQAELVMQVHDELVFEIPKASLEEFIPHLRFLMEETVVLSVPLEVCIGHGLNWDLAHYVA